MTIATKRVGDYRSEIVIAAGSATTFVALAAVFALARRGDNIMMWYVNYIIPVGAIAVGAIAAIGFGVAGRVTGIKMTRRLIWSVAGQLVLSYFIAQYEEYQQSAPGAYGFWSWFDEMTRSITWGHGEPVGAIGYAMRALEIGGFIAGGLIPPLVLRAKPYCDPCRTYKRTKPIAIVRGGHPGDNGAEQTKLIFDAAATGDRAELERVVAKVGPLAEQHAVDEQDARIWVRLVRCPRCAGSELCALYHRGHGKHLRVFTLGTLPLPGEKVRALFDRPS